jgi:transcriptional regulator with XRE-family HTH domain
MIDHVGRKIRRYRMMKEITQKKLADMIHKERPLISHIERTGKVNHETYLAICKALNITPEALESLAEEPFSNWGAGNVHTLKLMQAEIERLQSEIRLKDEMILLLKSHNKELSRKK